MMSLSSSSYRTIRIGHFDRRYHTSASIFARCMYSSSHHVLFQSCLAQDSILRALHPLQCERFLIKVNRNCIPAASCIVVTFPARLMHISGPQTQPAQCQLIRVWATHIQTGTIDVFSAPLVSYIKGKFTRLGFVWFRCLPLC